MLEIYPEGILETKNYVDFQIRSHEGQIIVEFSGAAKAAKALPGDTVEWLPRTGTCRLLTRGKHPVLAGVLEINSKTKYGMTSRGSPLYLFLPFNKSYPMMIVGSSERDTSKNILALVDFDDWSTTGLARGILRRVLGRVGEYDAEQEALLWTYNPFQYTSKLLQNVFTMPQPDVSSSRVPHPQLCFNIDPPGCKDVDDVIGLVLGETEVELWITIADVAEVVPEGSVLDVYAQQQAATCYKDGCAVRPMLPFEFSEDKCSLLPGGSNPAVSLVLTYTKGQYDSPISRKWVETTVQNDRSYTYDEFLVAAQADGIPVLMLHAMAKGLYEKTLYTDVHTWVEAFMLTYNLEVAKVLRRANKGILRKHSAAEYSRQQLYSQWGISQLAQKAAEYCTANDPAPLHHGLIAEVYCHATSPIRRYADLVNQRVLKQVIRTEASSDNVSPLLLTQLNRRQTDLKRFERDAFLLQQVRNGSGNVQSLVLERKERMLENQSQPLVRLKMWIPAWKRMFTWSTMTAIPKDVVPGLSIHLSYFANPTARFWKDHIAFRYDRIAEL